MVWLAGFAISCFGLLWIGSGAFGAEVSQERRSFVLSRGGVVVVIGLVAMFAGTSFASTNARLQLGVDVIVALLLAALIIAHFSRSGDDDPAA